MVRRNLNAIGAGSMVGGVGAWVSFIGGTVTGLCLVRSIAAGVVLSGVLGFRVGVGWSVSSLGGGSGVVVM